SAADRLRRGNVLRGAGDHGPLAPPAPGRDAFATRAGRGNQTVQPFQEKGVMTMTEQEILAGLGEIVEEIAGVPADEVTPNKSFVDDLDIDSLSMVEIAVAAQDKFGVEIPDDQLKDLKTVQDVVNFVSKSARPFSSPGSARPPRWAGTSRRPGRACWPDAAGYGRSTSRGWRICRCG